MSASCAATASVTTPDFCYGARTLTPAERAISIEISLLNTKKKRRADVSGAGTDMKISQDDNSRGGRPLTFTHFCAGIAVSAQAVGPQRLICKGQSRRS
jgi:hypothetical protein